MKTKILLIAALAISLAGCGNRSASNYYGKWEMLTIENGDTIIFRPCEYQNRAITYTKDSLIDIAGQDDARCKIISSFTKGRKTFIVLEPNCSYVDTISCEIINNHLVKWNLYYGISFLTTNHPERYKTVHEECEKESGFDSNKADSTAKLEIVTFERDSQTEILMTYHDLTLIEAYLRFLNDEPEISKHLLKKIPISIENDETTYTSNVDEEQVEITYQPNFDEDSLFIVLRTSAGVTHVKFETGADNKGREEIRVRIIFSRI